MPMWNERRKGYKRGKKNREKEDLSEDRKRKKEKKNAGRIVKRERE